MRAWTKRGIRDRNNGSGELDGFIVARPAAADRENWTDSQSQWHVPVFGEPVEGGVDGVRDAVAFGRVEESEVADEAAEGGGVLAVEGQGGQATVDDVFGEFSGQVVEVGFEVGLPGVQVGDDGL